MYHQVGMALEKSKNKADSEIKLMSISITQALWSSGYLKSSIIWNSRKKIMVILSCHLAVFCL